MSFHCKKYILINSLIIGLSCGIPSAWSTVDSTELGPGTYTQPPSKIFIQETGFFQFPGTSGELNSFNTATKCPANFSPYVVLSASKILQDTYSPAPYTGRNPILGSGICVKGIVENPTNYQVSYLTSTTYAREQRTIALTFYTYVEAYAFDADSTSSTLRRFAVYQLTWTPPTYNAVGGFFWELLCYPQGVTPPPFDPGCQIGTNPF